MFTQYISNSKGTPAGYRPLWTTFNRTLPKLQAALRLLSHLSVLQGVSDLSDGTFLAKTICSFSNKFHLQKRQISTGYRQGQPVGILPLKAANYFIKISNKGITGGWFHLLNVVCYKCSHNPWEIFHIVLYGHIERKKLIDHKKHTTLSEQWCYISLLDLTETLNITKRKM